MSRPTIRRSRPSRPSRPSGPWPLAVVTLLGLLLVATACQAGADDEAPVSTDLPQNGLCRMLSPADVERPDNDTAAVDCAEPHTAETFLVARLPERFDPVPYDAKSIGNFAYAQCTDAFREHLGADDSLVMRAMVSWAFFRPSEAAWDAGARWIRCDLLGGAESSEEYLALPEDTEGLLGERTHDEWMVCATGDSVDGPKVPCSEPHSWRAVTTIKVGKPDEPYPGDDKVASLTKDYCSKSVGGWLAYPEDYQFGYTYFHEAEWEAGNRRSVCWAKTDH